MLLMPPHASHASEAVDRAWPAPELAARVRFPLMRRDELLALLRSHHDEMAERFGVRSLSLFGSHARDTARPDSDVDLLVEFEGPATFDGYMGLIDYLEDLLGRPVDIATPRSLKLRVRPYVERDLVRVV